jgi:DNA-binding response OmpR family regulator
MTERILIIEDEPSVREVVQAYLERDGFDVYAAASGGEGLSLAEAVKPALVILDLMLPDLSGERLCTEVRSRSDVPVLILTAKSSEDHRVRGLGLGADDYVTKPFSPRELVARVRAVLRRTDGAATPLVPVRSFDGGRMRIDIRRHEVTLAGRSVRLTPSEFKLLVALAQFPGRAYSRFELINRVQGHEFGGYERTIDAHVKNLRRKIEPDPGSPRYVETVPGVGYRLGARTP